MAVWQMFSITIKCLGEKPGFPPPPEPVSSFCLSNLFLPAFCQDGKVVPAEDPSQTSFGHVPLLTEGWKSRAQMCVHKLVRIVRPGGMLKPARSTVERLLVEGIGKELADNVGRRVLHSIPEWYPLSLADIIAERTDGT